MAENTKTLNVRFQQKIDTAANWLNSTIVLLAGEIAIESDTNKFKFGDGAHVFKDLPYAGIDQAQLDAIEDNYYRVTPNESETDEAALARVVTSPKKGDIAVVERVIGGVSTVSSLTAYMYNGSAWQALDGNYDASNIYFDQDLITSFAMGNVSLTNGMATINATGKNLMEVWESIYVKEINTDLKNSAPSCGVSGNSTKYYLVGAASDAQTITLSLNKGSYDYGYGYVESKDETDPAAGTAAVTRVTNDGTGVVPVATSPYALTWDGTAVTPYATNGNVFVCSSLTKTTAPVQAKMSGTVKYEKAGNPVSNLGKIYPAQAYADATSSANEKVLARWYYPMYKGFTYTDGTDGAAVVEDHANITGARVQQFASVTGEDAYNKTQTKSATATKAWRQYYYAFPKAYGWVMKNAKDGNNIDCTVRKAGNVTLTFNNVNVEYEVYYINNGSDYGTLSISWGF
jgi:hypothetical protein